MVGPLVEFGIERDDAAIGVLQLLVQMHQLVAAFFELLKLQQHFAVLLPDFLDRIGRRIARERLGERVRELRDACLSRASRLPGSGSAMRDPGAALRPGIDRKMSHQTLRAAQPDAQPCAERHPARSAPASRQAGMPGPLVRTR